MIDISLCEKEQIHIPGFIQPHGFALSYLIATKEITGTSGNFGNIIGANLATIVTKRLYAFVEKCEEKSIVREVLNDERFWNETQEDTTYDIVWSRSGEEGMIELIKINPANKTQCISTDAFVSDFFEKVSSSRNIEDICEQGAKEVRHITGFDRVMIYRFDTDFNGRVIAESKCDALSSYMDLNFPASDIPAQARELYVKQTVRIIPDVGYTPVPFYRKATFPPLDMTHSLLRSVSPVHIEYLKNMEVSATLTISILVEGKLWGLIACHHMDLHHMTLRKIEQCRTFGTMFSSVLKIYLNAEKQRQNIYLNSFLVSVINSLEVDSDSGDSILPLLGRYTGLFQNMFQCDGFFIATDGEMFSVCRIADDEISLLKRAILPLVCNSTFYTDSLKSVDPSLPPDFLRKFSGLLIVKIMLQVPTYCVWFRAEITKTLTWGGDPNDKGFVDEQGKISPRTSFAAFKEIVRFKSNPWSEVELAFLPRFIDEIEKFYQKTLSKQKMIFQQKRITEMEYEKSLHMSELLESLIDMIEKRDPYTAGHTGRVSDYCEKIAQKIGLDKEETMILKEAAILHDIGKIAIPDAILLKPGRLSEEERDIIKTHLDVGYQILHHISHYTPHAEIVLNHHEKYDGTGYPRGIAGENIPLTAHIMIVADAIDAMTSNRIYQSRKSMNEALEEIVKYKGVWYHPAVVDAALEALSDIALGAQTAQLPLTPIERARFLYYFQDQLTGVHNDFYLKIVFDGKIRDIHFSHWLMVKLHNLDTQKNAEELHLIDSHIKNICEQIQQVFPPENIFRVFGNAFIIGCFSEEEKGEYKARFQKLPLNGVALYDIAINNSDKEYKSVFSRQDIKILEKL